MKTVVMLICLAIALSGCASGNYAVGRDFASNQVENIVRGKTTSADLLRIFGTPFTKLAISATDEHWTYSYSAGTTHATAMPFNTSVSAEGHMKTLDVVLSNGVVVNYTFNDAPLGISSKAN